MASNGCEELMKAWFPTTITAERKSLTEADIRDIAQVLLRTSDVSWSRMPRIYSVLRIIDQLQAIDNFLAEGITDVWFPFSQRSLPASFGPQSARLNFLDAQHLVFNTKALNLEREHTKHGHFQNTSEIPLKKIGDLGKGGYGFVDRVVSTISHREYARKLIPRGRTFKKDKQVLRAFERELSNLKNLSQQHTHIIELVGSYTDPKYVGILMLPVADCNLHELLLRPLEDGETSLLRTFFGCLTSALCFLHDSRIRHKDIKPQNVLVKNAHVFLTDFGVSLDWSELSHSTTTGPTWSTPRYGAPEVAEHAARNSSADIWSLGCVFLEIWTVLKQKTTQALLHYMESTGTLSSCYCSNIASIDSWIKALKALPGPQADNIPATWIAQMLQRDRDARWTAHALAENIREYNNDPTAPFAFAGLCCLDDDDTAESVHSSIDEDMNDLTLRPSSSPQSLGHTSLPETPVIATETQSEIVHEIPGQSHLSTLLQDQPWHNQPPQPYVADEDRSDARESRNDFNAPTSTHVLLPEEIHDNEKSTSQHGILSSPILNAVGLSFQDALNARRRASQNGCYDSFSNFSCDSDLERDPESGRRIARPLSGDRTVSEQVLPLLYEIVQMKDEGEKERGGGRPVMSRRTFKEELPAETDSDESLAANVHHEESQRSVSRPRHRPASPTKYWYPGLGPIDLGAATSRRTVLREPTRTRSPSPLPSLRPASLSNSLMVCLACMKGNLPANKTARLGCGHRMCDTCLRAKFQDSIDDPRRMPPTCCTAKHIQLYRVEHLFDDKFKKQWKLKYQEYEYSTNTLYCPVGFCGEWIEPSKIRTDRKTDSKYARCSHCNTKVCVLCKREFHRWSRCLEADNGGGKGAKPTSSRPDPDTYRGKIVSEDIRWGARSGGPESDAKPKLGRRSRRQEAAQGEEERAKTGKHGPDSVSYGGKIGPEDIQRSGTQNQIQELYYAGMPRMFTSLR